jgi:hypothetical protein
MKHAWGCMLLVACGTSGEPMNGDITLMYGDSSPKLIVGAAVEDTDAPGQMLVEMGDDNVDCDTNFSQLSFGVSGTFVYFSVDATTPGTQSDLFVTVLRSSGNHLSSNSTDGTVTIDTVSPRVTGSIMFETTDNDVGPITVNGSFDVKRCF